ncbi:MAG: pyridoxine 5'-phosphate synthase [Spartobacteria bacterium]|nr:pyridoxine 5'-phosphate synthase [Spartobacteria bacterium]
MKLLLGVNVDHVATLRQARGTDYPSPLEAAGACKKAGADGITIHLREDRRHIVDADVYAMKEQGPLPLNLEMANAPDIVAIALKVKPEEVCLVPEKRQELTTEGGLDVIGQRAALADTIAAMTDAGIVVSLFVDPHPDQLQAAADVGAPVVELHTGTYCDAAADAQEQDLETLRRGARFAHNLGLRVNAGHGINMHNIDGILTIPHLYALNIGHSIVARAVMLGMEQAVREMIEAMAAYKGGAP